MYYRKCRYSTLVLSALLAVLIFSSVRWTAVESQAAASTALFSIAKLVLNRCVYLGLDKAGEHYMGASWKGFKTVLKPLIDKFPGLLAEGKRREDAAAKAINALDHDKHLQSAILSRLQNLERGQEEIWYRIEGLQAFLADHERRIRKLETLMQVPVEEAEVLLEVKEEDTTFNMAVHKFLKEARHNFRNIKGAKLAGNKYESLVTLPGAFRCQYSNKVVCKFFDTYISYYYKKPAGIKRKKTHSIEDILKWKRDKTKVNSPTREEALLTYVELVKKFRAALPPYWKIVKPRHPSVWKKRTAWDKPSSEIEEHQTFKAQAGDGRAVHINFNGHIAVWGKMYDVSVIFYSSSQ